MSANDQPVTASQEQAALGRASVNCYLLVNRGDACRSSAQPLALLSQHTGAHLQSRCELRKPAEQKMKYSWLVALSMTSGCICLLPAIMLSVEVYGQFAWWRGTRQ